MIITVDYKTLDYVSRQRDLQKFYFIDGDRITFFISAQNLTMRSVLPYDPSPAFMTDYLKNALRVIDVKFTEDLLVDTRNLLERAELRSITTLTDIKEEK